MSAPRVLVVGAGPAGLSAAIELAQRGVRVTLIEQRDQAGGAIYRAHRGEGMDPVRLSGAHRRRWARLSAGLAAAGERIERRFACVYIGTERDGCCLIDDRGAGQVVGLRADALIMAVGTVEQVRPVAGWELPGVCAAGGMQVQLKETGEAPQGPILIAGSGPLTLALAAQLVKAGNPPVAVLERGSPFRAATQRPGACLALLQSGPPLQEAVGCLQTLRRAAVPYRTGWWVEAVHARDHGLTVLCRDERGRRREHAVRHLALHDGLRPNSLGSAWPTPARVWTVRAGDCREVLGASAAIVDGRRAARAVAAHLGLPWAADAPHIDARLEARLQRERRTQAALHALLASPSRPLEGDPIICRCEGLRQSDLLAFSGPCTAKELRLQGRFGMGACQGRSCHRAVAELSGGPAVAGPALDEAQVPRWPLRPVSVSAMAAYAPPET